jgi:hypothetical protein
MPDVLTNKKWNKLTKSIHKCWKCLQIGFALLPKIIAFHLRQIKEKIIIRCFEN